MKSFIFSRLKRPEKPLPWQASVRRDYGQEAMDLRRLSEFVPLSPSDLHRLKNEALQRSPSRCPARSAVRWS